MGRGAALEEAAPGCGEGAGAVPVSGSGGAERLSRQAGRGAGGSADLCPALPARRARRWPPLAQLPGLGFKKERPTHPRLRRSAVRMGTNLPF